MNKSRDIASVHAVLRRAARGALDLVFPPQCALCGGGFEPEPASDLMLCRECREDLDLSPDPTCPRCAAPARGGDIGKPDCRLCRHDDYHFDRVLALGVYRDRLREAVLAMKQPHHEPLALTIAEILVRQVRENLQGERPDVVTAIPMHLARRLVRGHNTPDLLAERVAAVLRAPMALDLLRCRRRIGKQGGLPPRQRRLNVRGAWRASGTYVLDGAYVLLIDDVLTTGATANEAAKVLRRAGAACVTAAVVARGVGEDW